MDGNGGCCIARWTDGGHVASSGYDKSKMDMIMLKFRPIAPKPVSPGGTPVTTSDCSNNSPRDGPNAKGMGPTRGRRKNNNNNTKTKVNTNSKSSNNGRKRKSNSPENRTAEIVHHDYDDEDRTVGGGVTLLPLFPEAPDLTPQKQQEDNNNINIPMMWLNFTNNTPGFENNYGNTQGYGW